MGNYENFKAAFEFLTEREFSTDRLSKRIITQKIAYLLHKKNVGIYNDFFWYIHGVLSWNLWNDTLRPCETSAEPLPEEALNSLKKIKDEFSKAELTDYFNDADKLELITTIIYKAKKQEELEENNARLISQVREAKNKFSEEEIRTAISKLKKVKWKF